MRRERSIDASRPARGQRLNLAEHEMHHVVEQLEAGLVHASDRPEIEVRILRFLDRANGPTTAGIAAEMRIRPEAAAIHLAELENADRAWRQPSHGADDAWHISLEGQHFLEQRGLLNRGFKPARSRERFIEVLAGV